MPDDRTILLQLIGSLTLCDHMGDVTDDIVKALELAGVELGRWDDLSDLRQALGRMGVVTLYGTTLLDDGEDGP